MADTENTYDLLDEAILTKIKEGRAVYNACTARWVAMQLNLSADVCRHRLLKMQAQGRVDWNEMAGSLTVVEVEQGVAAEEEEAPLPSTDETPESDQPQPTSETEDPTADEPSPDQAAPRSAKARPASTKG